MITGSWLSGSWRSFSYSSSVYSCHLFLITSASVRSITSVLYFIHLCMKYSVSISSFLEESFSLSHSIVFLYIDHWGRLSYLSLLFFETLNSDGYLSFSPLHFTSFLSSAICKVISNNHFPFCISFFGGWIW